MKRLTAFCALAAAGVTILLWRGCEAPGDGDQAAPVPPSPPRDRADSLPDSSVGTLSAPASDAVRAPLAQGTTEGPAEELTFIVERAESSERISGAQLYGWAGRPPRGSWTLELLGATDQRGQLRVSRSRVERYPSIVTRAERFAAAEMSTAALPSQVVVKLARGHTVGAIVRGGAGVALEGIDVVASYGAPLSPATAYDVASGDGGSYQGVLSQRATTDASGLALIDGLSAAIEPVYINLAELGWVVQEARPALFAPVAPDARVELTVAPLFGAAATFIDAEILWSKIRYSTGAVAFDSEHHWPASACREHLAAKFPGAQIVVLPDPAPRDRGVTFEYYSRRCGWGSVTVEALPFEQLLVEGPIVIAASAIAGAEGEEVDAPLFTRVAFVSPEGTVVSVDHFLLEDAAGRLYEIGADGQWLPRQSYNVRAAGSLLHHALLGAPIVQAGDDVEIPLAATTAMVRISATRAGKLPIEAFSLEIVNQGYSSFHVVRDRSVDLALLAGAVSIKAESHDQLEGTFQGVLEPTSDGEPTIVEIALE